MDDNRCFVQFPHPQREHGPTDGKIWHCLERHGRKQSHMRKFMQLRGRWMIDVRGDQQTGNLHAWGEWEPESELIAQLSPPAGDSPYPRCLWRPYYVPKDSYEGLHNTDPFIFGPFFLYSNCFQSSKPGLKQLDKGSVIAFGSGKKIDGEWHWMLDTVFVVRDFKDYRLSHVLDNLKDWAPTTFLAVTGGPLCADATGGSSCTSPSKKRGELLRLYVGATPDDPVDGMFSFFPASPARVDAGFPRPFVELPGINPKSFRSPSGFLRPRPPDELRDLWASLASQVRNEGLVLGTYAELPEPR